MRGGWGDTRKGMDGNDDWEVLREPLLDVQPLSPSSGSESSPRDIVLVSRSGSGDADVHAGSPQAASPRVAAASARENSVALVANDRGLRLTALGSNTGSLRALEAAAPAAASSSALTLPATSPRCNPVAAAGCHGSSAPARLSIGMGEADGGAVARERQQGGGGPGGGGGGVSYGTWCCCCWV